MGVGVRFRSTNEHFPNAIYFIDELDVHLHTRLQHALIREVVEHWIPDCSQLWTASHSLGFIEYASDAPDAVVVDFDDLDFDRPQVLTPSPKSADIFDIAVPRDAALKVFPNRTLVLCENRDVVLYNAIDLPDFLFVAARDKNAVGLQVRANEELHGLVDRDYLGSGEIELLRREQPRLLVLRYCSIESYLFHRPSISRGRHGCGKPSPTCWASRRVGRHPRCRTCRRERVGATTGFLSTQEPSGAGMRGAPEPIRRAGRRPRS